jgi:hypothetical protein
VCQFKEMGREWWNFNRRAKDALDTLRSKKEGGQGTTFGVLQTELYE